MTHLDALMLMVVLSQRDMVEGMLLKKVNLNLQNNDGKTALIAGQGSERYRNN